MEELREESKVLWALEKESFNKILTKTDVEKELFYLVDELITSNIILYQDFVDQIMDGFSSMEDTDDLNKRKENIQALYSKVLEHFKQIKNEYSKKE